MTDLYADQICASVHSGGEGYLDPSWPDSPDALSGLRPIVKIEADQSDPGGQVMTLGFSLYDKRLDVRFNVTDGSPVAQGLNIALAGLVRFCVHNADRIKAISENPEIE